MSRPPNWPFDLSDTWGQDRSNLSEWDQRTWTLHEREVFETWAKMRRVFGSDWMYQENWKQASPCRGPGAFHACMLLLEDTGWIRREEIISGVIYQALPPQLAGEPELKRREEQRLRDLKRRRMAMRVLALVVVMLGLWGVL